MYAAPSQQPAPVLPVQVIQEIHRQVAAGVQPLQAVESVTQQRMGSQVRLAWNSSAAPAAALAAVSMMGTTRS